MTTKETQEEINKKMETVGLTREEKNAMIEHVFSSPLRSPYAPILSRWKFISKPLAYALACFIFVFASGSGIVYSSLSAVPGESLYGIKVGLVEPILDTFAFSSLSRAKLDADKAIRRLEEADTLLRNDNLTPEHRTEIENRFKQNADDFDNTIESARKHSSQKKDKKSEDEIENLKNNFEKSLDARAENLKRKGEKSENKKQKQEVDSLEKTVRERVRQKDKSLNNKN